MMTTMGRRRRLTGFGVLAVLTLSACSGQPDSESATAVGQSSPAGMSTAPGGPAATASRSIDAPPRPPAPTGPPPSAPGGPGDDQADLPTPLPYPSWDDTSRTNAEDVAEAALTAFARPDADATEWWAALQPYLTPQARTAYTDTDPAQVPARAVSGPAVLVDDASPYLAGVDVPTDAGVYRVLLAREGGGAPWLVERLTPPPSLQVAPTGPGSP